MKIVSIRNGFCLLQFILVCLFTLSINQNSHGATETQVQSYFTNICSDHGGVNCSILNPDSSIVCNDGTVDKSFSVYLLPQCQESIKNSVKKQSDFMKESGCVPPGEMACINEESYNNLYKILNVSKLAESELGKIELSQCRQNIKIYQEKNRDYKQCLIKHNNPQFDLPTNRLVQPILKTLFCPMFYGGNASYRPDADLCMCNSGYFLYNEKCTEASSICQAKYGISAYAKNGNCLIPQNTATPGPTIALVATIKTTPVHPPQPAHTISTPHDLIPSNTPISYETTSDQEIIKEPLTQQHNPFKSFLNSFVSGVKKILKFL